MKTVKKLTAIALACLMLLGSFGLGASAIIEGIPVSKVEIELNRNVGGLTVEDYAKFIKIKTKDLTFDTGEDGEDLPIEVFYGGPIYTMSGIAPAGIGSVPANTDPVEKFTAGKSYMVCLYLTFEEDSDYMFPDSYISALVSGIGTEAHVISPYKCVVIFGFTAQAKSGIAEFFSKLFGNSSVIDQVDLTVSGDFTGLTIEDYEDFAALNTKGVDFYPDYPLEIYDVEEQYFLNNDDEMIEGKEYELYFYFISDEDKIFSDELKTTVNGESCENWIFNDSDYGEYMEIDVTIVAGEELPGGDVDDGGNGFLQAIIDFFTRIFGSIIGKPE